MAVSSNFVGGQNREVFLFVFCVCFLELSKAQTKTVPHSQSEIKFGH